MGGHSNLAATLSAIRLIVLGHNWAQAMRPTETDHATMYRCNKGL